MMSKQASRSARLFSSFRNAMNAGLGIMLLKFLVGLVIVLSLTGALDSVLKSFQNVFSGSQSNLEPRNSLLQKTHAAEFKTPP
jgi:hypothetical protein